MKEDHILIMSSFVCFGIGLLLGAALGHSIALIVALVASGIGSVLMLIATNRHR